MDIVNTITSLISTVGFPIICVIYLWKDKTGSQKELTAAVNNLAKINEKLYDKLCEDKRGDHDENI